MDCASRDVQGRCHFRSFEPVCRSQRRAIIRVRFEVREGKEGPGQTSPGRRRGHARGRRIYVILDSICAVHDFGIAKGEQRSRLPDNREL